MKIVLIFQRETCSVIFWRRTWWHGLFTICFCSSSRGGSLLGFVFFSPSVHQTHKPLNKIKFVFEIECVAWATGKERVVFEIECVDWRKKKESVLCLRLRAWGVRENACCVRDWVCCVSDRERACCVRDTVCWARELKSMCCRVVSKGISCHIIKLWVKTLFARRNSLVWDSVEMFSITS